MSLVDRVKDKLYWPHPALIIGTFVLFVVADGAGYNGIAAFLAFAVGSMATERDASDRISKALLSHPDLSKGGEE